MNSAETLKLNKEFKTLYYRGKCVVTRSIVVYLGKNRLPGNRLGLTCGKTIGKAFRRNRAKRLMRESYRMLSSDIKQGYDIVLIARASINGKKCTDVFKDLNYALRKLDMLK